MTLDPDRRHAIEVRFLGRMHWSLLGVALVLGWGVPQGWPRGLFLAGLTAVTLAMNVPAYRVLRRATREGVPVRFVRALWVPLVLRALATTAVLTMLAR